MPSTTPSPTRRHRWQTVAYAIVAVLAACFLVKNHRELPAAWAALHDADPRWVLVGMIGLVVGIVNRGMLHSAAQRAAGLDPGPFGLVGTAAAATALNDIAKTNGVAGVAVFLRRAGERGEPRGPTVAAYVLATLSGDLMFAMTLLVALRLLAVDGHLRPTISTAAVIFFVMLATKIALVGAAIHSRSTVRGLFRFPRRVIDRVRRRPLRPVTTAAADELFDATLLVRRHLRLGGRVVAHSLVVELIGVVSLWASLHAVGAHVDPVVPFVGYAVSVLFSNISFVPGGVGLVELSLGAVLVAYGVRGADAAAAVLICRLFELWMPLGFGAWCARTRSTPGLGCAPRDAGAVLPEDQDTTQEHPYPTPLKGAIS